MIALNITLGERNNVIIAAVPNAHSALNQTDIHESKRKDSST